MTKHRRFIPPQAAIEEGADVASSPPAKERQKPELNDWEDEGGSLAEPSIPTSAKESGEQGGVGALPLVERRRIPV